ncbi:transposase [Acetobacter oryzoeni]|uniref:Transposase n=1 Tax=Acetobacter oryzoeni TaxID=2500548 RepID=A0A5B9GJR9_9PROT|nr:transposase [Acetobacter oryzoeni]
MCSRKTRFSIYKKRNIIKRFFARLKQFRGIATRYRQAEINLLCINTTRLRYDRS